MCVPLAIYARQALVRNTTNAGSGSTLIGHRLIIGNQENGMLSAQIGRSLQDLVAFLNEFHGKHSHLCLHKQGIGLLLVSKTPS